MGRGFVEYTHAVSGRKDSVLFSAYFYYQLSDGAKLSVFETPAWCYKCKSFITAEEIPTLESLAAEIEKLQAGDPELAKFWSYVLDGAPIEKRIEQLRIRCGWRQSRRSPPRCLECGETDIVATPSAGDSEFKHPETGETLLVSGYGWTDLLPFIVEFTPEGERIGEQTFDDWEFDIIR
ncbi:hypothetical protein [Planctellipticum variicoloris]|uniref:hypothetical protein n=1 Tax=Planctellipticum variicoloris TaxID=3064265 RepID=UPI003013A24D|nr:hypothetical protein SH412_004962 [Planctomycetaceae bacterium SH412]